MDVKVIKFGGTSLCDAEHMKSAASIVLADGERRLVVVSAPGKRFAGDEKLTDRLYAIYDEPCQDRRRELLRAVRERFEEMARGLYCRVDFEDTFARMASEEAHLYGRDYFVSRGEYLCGMLFAAVLGYAFADAASCIFFAEDARLDMEKTRRAVGALIEKHPRIVIPGFYGCMPNGTVKTFPRGGSDITGAVIAAAVGAKLYENFTDVSGFMLADPKVVDKSDPIAIISYKELRRLSYMGAGVLHEDAVFPVRTAGIPINIRNTNRPEDKGTMIVPTKARRGAVSGITGKRGYALIQVARDRLGEDAPLLREIFSIFERRRITVYSVPRGIDSVGIAVSARDIAGKRDYIVNEICQYAMPDAVSVTDGVALLCIVGEDMPPRVFGEVFSVLASLGETPLVLDGGSDGLGFTVGIREENEETAIRLIYDKVKKLNSDIEREV